MKNKDNYIDLDNDLLQYLLCTEHVADTNKGDYDELEHILRSALDRCVDIRDYLKEL